MHSLSEKELKVLRPVITTYDKYLPGNVMSDKDIATKNPTSIYHSTTDPKCNYVSFIQVSPPNGDAESLSWKLEQGNAPSVIQFLTTQLNFRIEWVLKNNSEFDYNQKVRFLVVDVKRQIGPEPWDNKGDRIVFTTPKPGRTTKGCFVVPGQYQFFVIEDPGRNLGVKLRVTGFYPKCHLDKWAIYGTEKSDFCVKTCDGKKIIAYTNSKAEVGMIKRTYNPLLLDYVDLVLKEYFFNSGKPCLIDVPSIKQEEENPFVIITVTSEFGDSNNYRGSTDYTGLNIFGCGNSYTYPKVKLSNNNILGWSSTPADDKAQFLLRSAQKFRLSNITVYGESQTPQQAGIPGEIPDFYIRPAEYACNEQDLALLFYDVNAAEPVEFIAEESKNHPPLVSDAGGTIAMLLSPGVPDDGRIVRTFYLNATPDQQFTFTTGSTPQGFIPFAIRLNTPIWEYTLQGFISRYVAFGPGIFRAEMRLTLLGVNT